MSERKYYLFNGQRVALRKDGMVYYLLGDHLGSTSLVADAEGNKLAENRYYPYGEERLGSGTLPTDYRFTGQRMEQSLGIYAMGARWYDPYNARQTIEADIKEVNVVFKMHPLKMRSRGGIALQEQFSLFAANFVRWAMVWLQERVVRSSSHFDEALTRVKAMVRVAANTSAWVVGRDADLLVMFDETGAYPGVKLRLAGTWRTRPPMLPGKKVQKPGFRNGFASDCT